MAIFAHGGPGIGGGHLARSAAFAEWLAVKGAFSQITVTWDCPSLLADLFRPASGPQPLCGTLASFVESLQKSVRQADDMVIVLDTLCPEQSLTTSLAAMRSAALVHLNDSCGPCSCFDLIFDSDPMLGARSITSAPQRVFRGPEFAILNHAIVRMRPHKVPERHAIRRVMIALGAGGGARASGLARAIQERCPEVDVLGGPPQGGMGMRDGDASPLTNPAEYRHRLSTADVAVTQGGNTAFEAMALGVPCIVVPHPRFEKHTDRLVAAGLAIPCGGYADDTEIAEVIARCVGSPHHLLMTARHAFQNVDGLGALRVLSLLPSDNTTPQP
jgi:spore coat polysaccharide biosynthesis predicted glycosyltransferase SpsG